MDILKINEQAGTIAPPSLDNLDEANLLPTEFDEIPAPKEIASTVGGSASGSTPPPSSTPNNLLNAPAQPEAMSLEVAQQTAIQYVGLLNMVLAIIGRAVGGGEEGRYTLNEKEQKLYSRSMGEMLHYNNMTALNPNVMFLMMTAVMLIPKGRNAIADRKARLAAEDARAQAARMSQIKQAPRENTKENAKVSNANTSGSTGNAGTDADMNTLVNNWALPETLNLALAIPEVGLNRPNFKIADRSITPDAQKVFYACDIRNTRIKKGEHGAAVNGAPSKYFSEFLLACERAGLGEKASDIAAKELRDRIKKHYRISAEQINEQRAKLLK